MKRLISIAIILVLFSTLCANALESVSLGLAVEYLPTATVEKGEFGQHEESVYDNLSIQSSIRLGLPAGFKMGPLFSYYRKTIESESASPADVSIWGVGVFADYGYEFTESGRALFVLGTETGYSQLAEDILNEKRSNGAMWIDGVGGFRYLMSPSYSLELDYLLKWSNYDIEGVPLRHYKYSGSTLRLLIEYTLFANNKNEGIDK